MSIFKRPHASEYSYDFIVGGRRYSGSTQATDKREAKREEERLKKEARIDAATNKHHVLTLTFEQAALRWLEEVGQHHKNALTSLADVERLVARIGPKTLLANINNNVVASVVGQRRADRRNVGKDSVDYGLVSNATVNRSTTEPLRKILIRAEKAWEMKVQRIDWSQHMLHEPKERVREASSLEENKLFAELSEGYDDAVKFAILTGCRLDEIAGLKWSDVDFFTRQLTVLGKLGHKRTIPMSQAIFDLLFSQQGHHQVAVFTYVARRTDRRKNLIAGHRYQMTYSGLQTAAGRAVKQAEITDLRFHDLRHTAATRVLRKSNLRVVQHLLGHSDVSTTAKYAHAQNEDIRAALDATNPTQSPTRDHQPLSKSLKKIGNI